MLGAYLLLFPRASVEVVVPLPLLFTTFDLPALVVLGGWFLVQFLNGLMTISVVTQTGGVAWWAHIGGFVAGMVVYNTATAGDVTPGYYGCDGTKWVKMSRSFKDQKEFEELFESGAGGPMGDLGSSDIQITQKQTLFSVTTSYLAKLDLATAMQAIGEGAGDEVPVEMLSSIIQFENRVTLPGSIKSHNADEVQGNTLIWRPKATGVAEMTAESSSLRWGVVGGFIGGGVVVLAVIVALIVVLTRRRRQPVPIAAVAPEQVVAAVVGSTAASGAEFESAEGAEAALWTAYVMGGGMRARKRAQL